MESPKRGRNVTAAPKPSNSRNPRPRQRRHIPRDPPPASSSNSTTTTTTTAVPANSTILTSAIMGDLSGRHGPGGKPRLLGQVKTESLNFHTGTSNTGSGGGGGGGGLLGRASVALPPQTAPGAFTDLRRAQGGEDVLRASIRSMRELRESLRHAALLNIVAAANNDSAHPAGAPPTGLETRPQFLTAPSQMAPPHHQRGSGASPFNLQVMGSHGSPFPQAADGTGRSAGSGTHHTHSPSRDRSPAASPSPQTLVANLLSPRIRTISIPRPGPRSNDLPGPFIHKSVTQAKECLTRVGEMVRSRANVAEGAEPAAGGGGAGVPSMVSAAACSTLLPDVAMIRMSGTGAHGGGATSMQQSPVTLMPVQGHAMDTARHHHAPPTNNNDNYEKNRNTAGSFTKPSSAVSLDTISSAATTSLPPKSGTSLATTTNGSESSRVGTGKIGGGARSEGERVSSGQQVIGVRRHLTAGKKRELVKRLTEIAKCEAVDMTDPMANSDDEGDTNVNAFPPMIIMSQLHQHSHRHESSRPSSLIPARERPSGKEEEENEKVVEGGGRGVARGASGLHRTKSLSSLLTASNNNVGGARGAGGVGGEIPAAAGIQHPQGGAKPSATPGKSGLERTLSGSMPDLVAVELGEQNQGRRMLVSEQHESLYILDKPEGADPYSSDDKGGGAVKSLFTDGIVGKTIRKDGESGTDRAVESRPLLPATPNFLARRGARPSGRRSSIGLRDRGPADSSQNFSSTTTNVINLTPGNRKFNNGDTPAGQDASQAGTQPSEYIPSYSQSLPTLTITGLHRDRPAHGTAASNSRAAREMRPTSKTNVNISSSMHLFQQLDDQCEKLQRQLNIGLNMPRRAPIWPHGASPTTPPMNRNDVTDHLQCLPLGEGRGVDQLSIKGSVTPPDSCSASTFRRSSYTHSQVSRITSHAVLGVALSDVDEQSTGGRGVGFLTDRTQLLAGDRRLGGAGDHEASVCNSSSRHAVNDTKFGSESPSGSESISNANRGAGSSVVETDNGTVGTKQTFATPSSAACPTGDPVLKSLKEPRYQGPSSRVPEGEARSQFHYVHPSPVGTTTAADPSSEEAREMKYRVLKALDQDVYYDFQHRKYRNAPPTPATGDRSAAARCSKDEDRPRVHFYKVKVDGDS